MKKKTMLSQTITRSEGINFVSHERKKMNDRTMNCVSELNAKQKSKGKIAK